MYHYRKINYKPLQFLRYLHNYRKQRNISASSQSYKTTKSLYRQWHFLTLKKNWFSCSAISLKEDQLMHIVDEMIMKYSNDKFMPSDFLPATSLRKIESILKQVSELEREKLDLEDLKRNDSDSELRKIAAEDIENISCQLFTLREKVADCLLESQSISDIDEVLIEVSAGVGGQEAMLFTLSLLNMYRGFCATNGWSFDLIDFEDTALGGLRHACLAIKGPQSYLKLKYEGGIHRVQRVPSTEKAGRIHTSTASVAVLPQPSEIMVDIKKKDIKFETMRASGPGGQSVNKSDSAVRITHLPSGIVVECQKHRAQEKNKQFAMQTIRSKLYQREIEEQEAKSNTQKRLQIGTRARSDKIRTYNFPQDRVTDHRLGVTVYNLEQLLKGGGPLEKLVDELVVVGRKERLLDLFNFGK